MRVDPSITRISKTLAPESPTNSEPLVAFRAIFPSEVFRPGNGRISADAHATFTGQRVRDSEPSHFGMALRERLTTISSHNQG